MGRHVATKVNPDDLDQTDLRLLDELRALREAIDAGQAAKEERGPEVIGVLRARGVEAGMIADAFGVTRGRIYQVEVSPEA